MTDPHAFRPCARPWSSSWPCANRAGGDLDPEPAGLDKDWGTDTLRKGLEAGLRCDAILDGWRARNEVFPDAREVPNLLMDVTARLLEALGPDAVLTAPEDLSVYAYDT